MLLPGDLLGFDRSTGEGLQDYHHLNSCMREDNLAGYHLAPERCAEYAHAQAPTLWGTVPSAAALDSPCPGPRVGGRGWTRPELEGLPPLLHRWHLTITELPQKNHT